jgi:hypothetical protein
MEEEEKASATDITKDKMLAIVLRYVANFAAGGAPFLVFPAFLRCLSGVVCDRASTEHKSAKFACRSRRTIKVSGG